MAKPDLSLCDEAERLLREATPGPWWYNPSKCYRPGENGAKPVLRDQEAVFYARGTIALTGDSDDPQSMADAALIAATPRLLRDLSAALRGATATLSAVLTNTAPLVRSISVSAYRARDESPAAMRATLDDIAGHAERIADGLGATTTVSAEDQGWTWSNVPVLAPDATAQDAATGEQDPEALRAAIRALTQEVKHLRAELVRVQGEVLDVD